MINQILYEGHPSSNTNRAVYMFALASGDQVSRFLLVEAENRWAVLALERILLQGGQVSDNCRVMAIFRDTLSLGVRDALVTEIPYVDFMTDIVDLGRIVEDPIAKYCFGQSLSSDQKQYVARKFESSDAVQEPVETETAIVVRSSSDPEQPAKIANALCGLGFKKSEVRKFVQSLGSRVTQEPINALIREGIATLAA